MPRLILFLIKIIIVIQTLKMDNNCEGSGKIRKELIEYGFEDKYIDLALKMSSTQEEALDLIIKMMEDPVFYEETKGSNDSNGSISNKIDNCEAKINYKMVIIVRDDLKMGVGKIGAQVGHGVLGAYKAAVSKFPLSVKYWEEYSGSVKIVVAVHSEEELLLLRDKAKANNLPYYLVRDAGRTQIASGTITVCAIGPAQVTEVDNITGHLNLL